jgi:hypothetical protein
MQLWQISKIMKIIYTTIVMVLMTACLPTPVIFAEAQKIASSTKNSFSDAVNSFEKEREGFITAKEKYNEDESKEDNKTQYIEKSKEVLAGSINVLSKRNDELKNQIESESSLYGDLGQSILGMLDADNQKLNDFNFEISSATSTQSLSGTVAKIRDYRVQQQSYLRKLIILAHINQYENSTIKLAENRSQQLATKIDSMKSLNKNIGGLEDLLSQANDNISRAKFDLSTVKNLITQEVMDSVKLGDIETLLVNTQKYVKDAYQSFKDIAINGNQLFMASPDSSGTTTPPVTEITTSTQ